MTVFGKQCKENVAMWENKIKAHTMRTVAGGSLPPDIPPSTSDSTTSSPLALPTSPPDVSTMFALSLPTALYTPTPESRQSSWPASDASTPPLSAPTPPDVSDAAHVNERLNGTTSPGLISPLSASITAAVGRTSHCRHPSYTELPQVSIPTAPSASTSPFASQYRKSSSTTTSTSPLFSPHSIPTSSSSPRSDISNGSAPSTELSTLGLQFRPALRAVYDAHGRSKALKRLENRTSWQGSRPTSGFSSLPPRQADHGS